MIVDDHSMVATGLAKELDGQQDFQVTSVITSPEQVVTSLTGTASDVILMDIRMGVYNGIKMTEEIKKQYPEIKIIVIQLEKKSK